MQDEMWDPLLGTAGRMIFCSIELDCLCAANHRVYLSCNAVRSSIDARIAARNRTGTEPELHSGRIRARLEKFKSLFFVLPPT